MLNVTVFVCVCLQSPFFYAGNYIIYHIEYIIYKYRIQWLCLRKYCPLSLLIYIIATKKDISFVHYPTIIAIIFA